VPSLPAPPAPWPGHLQAQHDLRRAEQTLAGAPDDPAALFDRAEALDRLGRTEAARAAYLDVLARDFRHAPALARLGALLFAGGYTSAARTVFARAVAAHPDDPAARVNLAHLLRLAEQPDLARAEYAAALRLDPDCAEAHQGLSHLLDGIDEAAAAHHRARGYAGRVLSTAPYRGAAAPIVVLRLVSARGGNIPTGGILDDRVFLVHTLVADHADPNAVLPPHDVVFNAIGDADRCAAALHAAARLLERTAAPVLNPPARVLPTTRLANATRLAGLPGVIVPRIARLPRAALAAGVPEGFALPILLRSPGYHTGQHFRRVDDAAALPCAVAELPGEALLAIEYLDATGPDGASRKYRAMFIGGEILPLHLAISPDWKVHYYTAATGSNPAWQEEEARFIGDMAGTIGPVAMSALARIAAVLGLDYAGVDFAVAQDGRVLVFEANAAMTIAAPGVAMEAARKLVSASFLKKRSKKLLSLCAGVSRENSEPNG
jgi:tetratricopeptide (TPR) repeat protein